MKSKESLTYIIENVKVLIITKSSKQSWGKILKAMIWQN